MVQSISLPYSLLLHLQKRASDSSLLLDDYITKVLRQHSGWASDYKSGPGWSSNTDPFDEPGNLQTEETIGYSKPESIDVRSITTGRLRDHEHRPFLLPSPKIKEEWKTSFGAHTSRFFPLILLVRSLLAELQRRRADTIPYPEYIELAQNSASGFKLRLLTMFQHTQGYRPHAIDIAHGLPWIEIEAKMPKVGVTRATATPSKRRVETSARNFRSSYSQVNPMSKNPGPLVLLGLVSVEDGPNSGTRKREVGLTEAGLYLATECENPIIDSLEVLGDGPVFESCLSKAEVAFIQKQIGLRMKIEQQSLTAMRMVVGGDVHGFERRLVGGIAEYWTRKQLYEAYQKHTDSTTQGSDHTRNMAFSGLLGRLRDLDWFGVERGGGGKVLAYRVR